MFIYNVIGRYRLRCTSVGCRASGAGRRRRGRASVPVGRTCYRRRLEQVREESRQIRRGDGRVEVGGRAAGQRRRRRLQRAVEAQRVHVRQRQKVRAGRGLRVGAHPVRHHLLLGPRAERNYEQRQRGNGLSRGRCERDWRRATPRCTFINGTAVPYSVAARAAPPIARPRVSPPG